MIIDSHQHFWDPKRAEYPWLTEELEPLRRRFGPDELEPLLRAHAIDGTIVVQARHSLDETRELLDIARAKEFVLGVVGWVDLTGNVRKQLAQLEGPLVGIRHQVHDEPDPNWLLREDIQQALAVVGESGLAYDLLVRQRELPAALRTVRRHPETTFVLDHVAKRPVVDRYWSEGVSALAELPNVTCKLSGLFTETDPSGTVERAIRWFGPERCMFGSDWPVCLLATNYADTLAFAGSDQDILARTAIRAYKLNGL